ncbi:NAD(P)-binding domain-containing protein, partial [Streptomyces minutiscleroticus]|uniref:NAD(P)-binding domain-containing protein n=1 Tax=Streptomyces minutiscleroticus TaxID=68238 RepID=UPI0033332D74
MNEQSVTVIGLGPMGRAMVDTYLDHGYDVTVWNRTAARAESMVAEGSTTLSPASAEIGIAVISG